MPWVPEETLVFLTVSEPQEYGDFQSHIKYILYYEMTMNLWGPGSRCDGWKLTVSFLKTCMFEDLVLSPGAILGGCETFKRWILTGRNDLLVQALWVIYTHLSLNQSASQSVNLFVSQLPNSQCNVPATLHSCHCSFESLLQPDFSCHERHNPFKPWAKISLFLQAASSQEFGHSNEKVININTFQHKDTRPRC